MNDERIARALEAGRGHPGRTLAIKYAIFAGVFALWGVLCIHADAAVPGFMFLALGGYATWMGLMLVRGVRQVTLINVAFDRHARGDFDGARALLDAAERRTRLTPSARRAVAIERAIDAFSEGEAKQAEACAANAISGRKGLFTRTHERGQITMARALRALARASLRDHEGARADADAACAPDAWPQSHGYAALARAVVAAPEDRKAAVREALERGAPFLDHLDGRTRELARALARFAQHDVKRSIYRHPSKPETTDALDTWMAQVAPQAALHPSAAAPAGPATTLRDPTPPTASAVSALDHAREEWQPGLFDWRHHERYKGGDGRRRWTTLLLWGLLILMFLAIWQVLNPSAGPARPRPAPTESHDFASAIAFFAVVFVISMFALFARAIYAASKRQSEHRILSLAILRGDAQARERLERMAKAGLADAALDLASFAERNVDFAGAISVCEGALGRIGTLARRVMSWDIAAPGLAAERAFCLAAMGRPDDANAALAAMPNRDGYAHGTTARFRVSLAQALIRAGGAPCTDRALALEIARGRGLSLRLPSRDALLIDVLEATDGSGVDDEEWTRIQSELARSPMLAKWIDHFLPGASQRVKPRQHSVDAMAIR